MPSERNQYGQLYGERHIPEEGRDPFSSANTITARFACNAYFIRQPCVLKVQGLFVRKGSSRLIVNDSTRYRLRCFNWQIDTKCLIVYIKQ